MVYLAKDYKSGLIKIGYSEQPAIRERTLRAEIPEIDIIVILLGGRELEKSLHKQFKDSRVRGEWFNLSEQEISNIIASHPNLSRKLEDKFLSSAAERLLEVIEEHKSQDVFFPIFLSNNVLCDSRNLRNLLDELKKKRLIKYKWKDSIEVTLL